MSHTCANSPWQCAWHFIDEGVLNTLPQPMHCTSLCWSMWWMLSSQSDLPLKEQFLGGLSLHLNHLLGSRVTNYDWPFGTLPLGLFGSNLDTRDLDTYPRTYSGHFWHMSLFDDSRAIWVFLRKWVVSENQSFLDEGAIITHLINLVLGGQVPRLSHGPIWLAGQNTEGGAMGHWMSSTVFWHFDKG